MRHFTIKLIIAFCSLIVVFALIAVFFLYANFQKVLFAIKQEQFVNQNG
jgi:hypothetical protein